MLCFRNITNIISFLLVFTRISWKSETHPFVCNIWETLKRTPLFVSDIISGWLAKSTSRFTTYAYSTLDFGVFKPHENKQVYINTFVWQSRLKMKMGNYIWLPCQFTMHKDVCNGLEISTTICKSLSLYIHILCVRASITLMHTRFPDQRFVFVCEDRPYYLIEAKYSLMDSTQTLKMA